MIQGKIKTEAEYRATELDSSSSLKEFSLDRRKYYKRYYLNEKEEEEPNKAATIGLLVDCLLLEKEKFDDKFCLSCLAKPVEGIMGEFIEGLHRYTKLATNEKGEVTRPFEDIAKDAYKDSGFKYKFETVIEKFVGKDPEIQFKEILEIRTKGLTVVTLNDLHNAERIVEELKTNENTAEIVNLINSDRYEIHNQLQIEGYKIDDLVLKSMIDKVIIDHTLKDVIIIDLKCTWNVEDFYESYYLYRRAYIQAYLYYQAVRYYINEIRELENYHINYPRFLVCDSINYYKPLIYQTNGRTLGKAYDGFEYKGKDYPGVCKIIKDLRFCKEKNEWRISKDNFENDGIVNLN